MEASSFLPEGIQQTPQFSVWRVVENDQVIHRLVIDGEDIGVLDWDMSRDGTEGYIDGLDNEYRLGVRRTRAEAWLGIVASMHVHYPNLSKVIHLDGEVSITED